MICAVNDDNFQSTGLTTESVTVGMFLLPYAVRHNTFYMGGQEETAGRNRETKRATGVVSVAAEIPLYSLPKSSDLAAGVSAKPGLLASIPWAEALTYSKQQELTTQEKHSGKCVFCPSVSVCPAGLGDGCGLTWFSVSVFSPTPPDFGITFFPSSSNKLNDFQFRAYHSFGLEWTGLSFMKNY